MANHPLQENHPTHIAELRQHAQLTQLELAERVGVTETTIANWENGRADWIERIVLLIDALDCTLEDLLETPLIQLRKEAGFSRRSLAKAVGVRENTIATWENKESLHERIENIARLSVALKCASPEDLIPLSEKKVESAPAKLVKLSGKALLQELQQVQPNTNSQETIRNPSVS